MFSSSIPFSSRLPTPPPCSATTTRIGTSVSFYDVLGIQRGATQREIKTAYRQLARVIHPDVRPDGHDRSSTEEFMKVHMAYSTLADPRQRAEYDRGLFRSTGHSRRSWETDQCW